MSRRAKSALLGLLGGFAVGALFWLLDFFVANGADHMLGLVIGLTLGCGIMAFLFPIPSTGGFWVAGLKGLLGYEVGTLPDPVERRGKGRD